MEAGKTVAEVAGLPEVSDQSIYTWRRQELIDRGFGAVSRTSAERTPHSTAGSTGYLLRARRLWRALTRGRSGRPVRKMESEGAVAVLSTVP